MILYNRMTIVGNYHRYFKLYPYHTRILLSVNDFSLSKGENEITYQRNRLLRSIHCSVIILFMDDIY